MDHALLLQILITLVLAQLNDVVLTLAAGVVRINALLELLLARHAGRRLHGCV